MGGEGSCRRARGSGKGEWGGKSCRRAEGSEVALPHAHSPALPSSALPCALLPPPPPPRVQCDGSDVGRLPVRGGTPLRRDGLGPLVVRPRRDLQLHARREEGAGAGGGRGAEWSIPATVALGSMTHSVPRLTIPPPCTQVAGNASSMQLHARQRPTLFTPPAPPAAAADPAATAATACSPVLFTGASTDPVSQYYSSFTMAQRTAGSC